MKKGMLSIIIPYFCGEKYIEKTIDSILESKYKNFEIVIIDDGSPENKGVICDKLLERDNRVKVFHKSNSGIADTRNYGIEVSEGEFIAFVDQDDKVPDDMYSCLIQMLLMNECDMVVSNFKCHEEITEKMYDNQIIKFERVIEADKLNNLRKWLVMGEVLEEPEIIIPSTVWNCVFRADIVRNNNVKFESFIQYDDDWVFLLRYLSVCKKVYLTDKSYYCWHIHSSSESHTPRYLDNIEQRYENLKRFKLTYMSDCKVSVKEKERFDKYFYANFVYIVITNESIVVKDLASMAKSLRYIYQLCKLDRWGKMKLSDIGDVTNLLIMKKGKKAGMIYTLAKRKMYLAALLISKI